MKKARSHKPATTSDDDLRPEYAFDYSKAKPNPFAKELAERTIAVVLDPDVAEAFPDTRAVNSALRVLATVARRTQVQPRRSPQSQRSRKAG